jgi:hypothetical protein
MNTMVKAGALIALTLVFVVARAQTPAPTPTTELKHFDNAGLSLDYPGDFTLSDQSTSSGHNLLLRQGTGAQIMVVARHDAIDSPAQFAQARKDLFDPYVEGLRKEFQSQQAPFDRSDVQIEIAGAQATGVRLRAVLSGEAGNAEIYNLLLGRRLVIVSIIGSDKELAAATSGWSTVRRSLKLSSAAPATSNAHAPAMVPASVPVPQATPIPAPTFPDAGKVVGTIYTNEYFGLTLAFPNSWHVQESSLKKEIADKGKDLVTSNDPVKKGEIARAVDNVLNLLTISQFPMGEPNQENSLLICGAEKVAGVNTIADYMAALKNTLKYSQVPINIERDVYTEQIAGVPFAAMDFKTNYSGVFLNQKYYARIVKGYTLFFIVSYHTDEQLRTQAEILRSAVLR